MRELLADYLSQLSTADECDTAFNALRSLTVCDPTVGSGAFLFAALEVLDPLYEAVLGRAGELQDKNGDSQTADCLAEAQRHPSERYWMLKTLCLNNLYGVDLMDEAPEIAKLRLFLKLAAQIDDVSLVEPLPDLDFNIKTGNLLVGIAHEDDADRRLSEGRLDLGGEIGKIRQVAEQVGDAYRAYVTRQSSDLGTLDHATAKQKLYAKLEAARSLADALLHSLRSESTRHTFEEWRDSHQPFHWFVEFPSVWRRGGFDVVIGNPPYIDTGEIYEYRWVGYQTQRSPNLFAPCVERACMLLNADGRISMIVMHALCFNKAYLELRDQLSRQFPSIWVSSYDKRPDSLFAGSAQVRNSIIVCSSVGSSGLQSSRCHRWPSERRATLFSGISYVSPDQSLRKCGNTKQWPFTDCDSVADAFSRMVAENSRLSKALDTHSEMGLIFKKVGYAFLSVYQEPPPIVTPDGTTTTSPHGGQLYFVSEEHRDAALMTIASRWAFLWWCMYGDSFNVTKGTLAAFPAGIERLIAPGDDPTLIAASRRLLTLADELKTEMPNHLTWQTNAGVRVGRYNMIKCRHITDEADLMLARLWGVEDAYDAAGNLRDRMVFGNRE